MQTELEAKFLDINIQELRKQLVAVGATLVHSEQLMRRKNFDYPDGSLDKKGAWIRVRDEGDKITLAYKQLLDRTINGTKELSLVIEDFDKISDLLITIGLVLKSYQETKRERWELDEVEITIDTWPWIPSFVELEGGLESKIQEVASKLSLDWTKALHGSVESAYQAYYNVTEEEVNSWQKVIFSDIPESLKKLKK